MGCDCVMLAPMKGRIAGIVLLVALTTMVLGIPAAYAAPLCDGVAATIQGTAGDDVLVGTAGNDVIVAKNGDDVVRGGGGHDVICGGGGDDLLIGNDGADRIFGGNGADTLEGRRGRDLLDGGGGGDLILGNQGRDQIFGGLGVDTGKGGPGLDYCDAETQATCDDSDPAFYATPEVRSGGQTISVPSEMSLEGAVAAVQAGQTIVLEPGIHTLSGNLVLRASGTASDWVRVIGTPGSQRPTIDLAGAGELRISGSYVLVEHVEIINGGGNNIHIAPESEDISNIIVRDTVVSDLAWGPGAAIKINRNNPQGAGVSRVYLENNDVSEAIDNAVIDGVGVHKAVARGNWIHDNDQGSHGIFFKGGSSKILIEGNLISGIRGNAALQLGGNTGPGFFDPAHANWEGVDQLARNNLIADFDDSAVEIRGVKNGVVVHNTIVTQTSFAIFRMSAGETNAGGTSGNAALTISSNLVVGLGGDPQYARNDGGAATLDFGPQAWAGAFRNSGAPTPNVPLFPQGGDVVAGGALASVIADPTIGGYGGLAGTVARYAPDIGSPVLGAIDWRPDSVVDLRGIVRAPAASFGAIEEP